MQHLSRGVMKIILNAVSLTMIIGMGFLIVRYAKLHKDDEKPPFTVKVLQPEARDLSNGEFTRFIRAETYNFDVYRFTDPENGNTIYWWGEHVIAVPGQPQMKLEKRPRSMAHLY